MTSDKSPDRQSDNAGAGISPGDRTPETDLLDRYQQMVQTQVNTVNEIDEKAATTMRLVALLLGVLLSLFIFLAEDYTVELTDQSIVPILWIVVGISSLLTSLALCLYTYLSSRMLFGPKAVFGTVLAENRVMWTDYESKMLKGYAAAISTNREVIRTNSRRFRNTLLALVHGLLGLSLGLGLFAVDLSPTFDLLISFIVGVLTAIFTGYVLTERYMVVPHED